MGMQTRRETAFVELGRARLTFGCVCRVLVPAYEDPVLWEGHASMIEEVKAQLPEKPDAIFCSVGGGGLLGGVIVGCKRVGWDDGACGRCIYNRADESRSVDRQQCR